MLKKERQERILQTVSDKRYCTVNLLSKTLFVAPITIRRDLEEMEKAGLLKRCHGGAAIEDHRNREVPFELRDRENADAKICRNTIFSLLTSKEGGFILPFIILTGFLK